MNVDLTMGNIVMEQRDYLQYYIHNLLNLGESNFFYRKRNHLELAFNILIAMVNNIYSVISSNDGLIIEGPNEIIFWMFIIVPHKRNHQIVSP